MFFLFLRHAILKYIVLSHSVISDSLQSMNFSLLGSSVHGIFQARILEWDAISSSRGSSQHRDWTHNSCLLHCWWILYPLSHRESHVILKHTCSVVQSCLTLCNPMDCVAHQAPLSMGLSRQEYWSGLSVPSPNLRHTKSSNKNLVWKKPPATILQKISSSSIIIMYYSKTQTLE